MLKTISAALLAASVFAAPALAATKTAQAPAKTSQAPAAKTTAAKTTQAPVIKADRTKSKLMNANAKMHRHHARHHCFPNGGGPAFAGDGDANSNLPTEPLVSARDNHGFSILGQFSKHVAILLLPIALAACAGDDDGRSISFTDDRGV